MTIAKLILSCDRSAGSQTAGQMSFSGRVRRILSLSDGFGSPVYVNGSSIVNENYWQIACRSEAAST